MADSTLNYFVASGTAAERAAFTPTPPSPANAPPHQGYFFFETDTNLTYAWDSVAVAWVAVGGGTGGGVMVAAGTQVATSGTVNFANSNGVTFGMSGSTAVTASVRTDYAGTGITTATTTGTVLVGTNSSNGISLGVPAWITTAAAGGGSINVSAGTTSNNLTALTFSNGSGVSFGLNGSVITATVQTNYLTTAMASNRASDFVAATAAFAGTNASGTINSTGISVSVAPPSAASINISGGTTSSNLTAFKLIDSNGVSWSLDTGSKIYATVRTNYQSSGAYLTTAALSQDSSKYAGTAGAITGGSITVNTSGVSVNLPAYLTTAMLSNGGSNFVQATAVFAGTNASGTIASGGISVSVGAPGGGGAITFSAGTSSGSLNSVVFSDSGAISFGLSGSTITASANTVGTATTVYAVATNNSVGTVSRWAAEDHRHAGIGALGISTGNTSGTSGSVQGTYWFVGSNAVTLSQITTTNGSHTLVISAGAPPLSSYEPMVPAPGLSTVLVGLPTATSASVSIYPFVIEEYVSAGILNLAASVDFLTLGTSSGRQTAGLAVGLYTQNVSTLSSLASSSFSYGITGNNSTYSISQVTATNYTGYGAMAQTSSAGVNITSGYTGMKMLGIPINSLLSPGNYWLAVLGTNSTSSTNVGLSFSLLGAAMGTGLSGLAPVGSMSSALSTGLNPYGRWEVGQGIWTTATNVTMLPASMAFASISAAAQTYPLMRFWRT